MRARDRGVHSLLSTLTQAVAGLSQARRGTGRHAPTRALCVLRRVAARPRRRARRCAVALRAPREEAPRIARLRRLRRADRGARARTAARSGRCSPAGRD
jgi:hypothetical protein